MVALENNYKEFPSKINLNEQQLITFINLYNGIIAEETNINPNLYVNEGDIIRLNTSPPVFAIVQKIKYFKFSLHKKYIIQYKILAELDLKIYVL